MKTIKNILLVLFILVLCNCSVVKERGACIESLYQNENHIIEGAYTCFYNSDLKISEDLYAVYNPYSKNNVLPVNQFRTDQKIIGKCLGVELNPDNFVFQLQGKHGNMATHFYFLPQSKFAPKTIKEYKYKREFHNIYSLPTMNGQIIQLFSLNKKGRGSHKDYMNYLQECDAIIQKLCYGDYYKVSYPDSSEILIDLSNSRFSEKKLSLEMLSDTTLINTNSHKIISISPNREYTPVNFQLSQMIGNMIDSGKVIVCKIYNKESLLSNPLKAVPKLHKELKTNLFKLEVDISYNDYILTISDDSSNLFEVICLNIW